MLIAATQALTDGVVLLDRNNQIRVLQYHRRNSAGSGQPTDRGQPVLNLVRQPEFVAYLNPGITPNR
jgi:two-component system phosphate regulon sensor histidine kinase PhoR